MLRVIKIAAVLPLLALTVLLAATKCAAGAEQPAAVYAAPPARKTVLAWIAGDTNESAEFVLRGSGKGAVNAVSVGGLFNSASNATNVWLTVRAPSW